MEMEPKIPKVALKKKYNTLIMTSVGVTIWLIYIIIGIYSFLYKDSKLLYVMDEDGNFCGYGDLKTYNKLYLYKITEENVFTNRICVSECPQSFTGYLKSYKTNNNEKGVIEKKYFYKSKVCK